MRTAEGKVTFFGNPAAKTVIWMHTFSDEGERAFSMLPDALRQRAALVTIGLSEAEWNAKLSPWEAPALFRGEPFAGGADAWLETLTGRIMPAVTVQEGLAPAQHLLAGYSLAGLFALYAFYRTDVFCSAASISGSLWYPGFADFVRERRPCRAPEHLYLSLGDRESSVRNPVLASVWEHTAAISSYFSDSGVHTVFEATSGGHTNHAAERTAAALQWLIQQYKCTI